MTILSTTHKFAFVHLHKCGGSSVEAAFQPYAKWNDLVIGSTNEGEKLQPIYRKLHRIHKHNDAASLKTIVGAFWHEAWTFTMVRHPVSIYESFYKWIHKIISDFADSNEQTLETVKERIIDRDVDRTFMQYEVTMPFATAEDFNDFVFKFSKASTLGTLFHRLSENGKLIVDNVFKLEHPAEVWEALSKRTGAVIQPAHTNKGSKLTGIVWSDEMIRMVEDIHAIDLETFAYASKLTA